MSSVAAINEMLSYALDVGASDLHLSVGSVPMVRIHGDMKKLQLPIQIVCRIINITTPAI